MNNKTSTGGGNRKVGTPNSANSSNTLSIALRKCCRRKDICHTSVIIEMETPFSQYNTILYTKDAGYLNVPINYGKLINGNIQCKDIVLLAFYPWMTSISPAGAMALILSKDVNFNYITITQLSTNITKVYNTVIPFSSGPNDNFYWWFYYSSQPFPQVFNTDGTYKISFYS